LSEQLFSQGIIPYYLHLLDKAIGTGHFEVSETKAVALIKQAQATLPGYLVPKLVKEQAGQCPSNTSCKSRKYLFTQPNYSKDTYA